MHMQAIHLTVKMHLRSNESQSNLQFADLLSFIQRVNKPFLVAYKSCRGYLYLRPKMHEQLHQNSHQRAEHSTITE